MNVTTSTTPASTEPVAPQTKSVGPWGALEPLRQEIDRVFADFGFGSWGRPLPRAANDVVRSWPRSILSGVAPAVDVSEREGEIEITVELPGLDEKDVEVRLSNGSLTIKGEKTESKDEKTKEYHMSERRFGSFSRSFEIPAYVDREKIEATFAKGVLTVKLPKTAAAAKDNKKIDVKSA